MNFTENKWGKDFKWGVSTSAYQIEAGWDQDGKRKSVWDVFANTKGKISGGDTGNLASDFTIAIRTTWPSCASLIFPITVFPYPGAA